MREKLILSLFLLLIFGVLFFVNYRYLDITYLSLRSIDEYAFHGSLLNMYEGIKEFNIQKFFSFKFYSYGFGFFLTNLIATFPALINKNQELAIFIPRMVSSLFAILSLYCIYKISIEDFRGINRFLLMILILTIPAFYWNSGWFHPDWMMTGFIFISLLFYKRDNRLFQKNYWKATVCFAISVAIKVQAIIFLPFVFSYIFHEEATSLNFQLFRKHVFITFKTIFLLILIFIIANPYLLHPLGLEAFLKSFSDNLSSNATNHGNNIELSVMDKFQSVIQDFYFNYLLIALIGYLLILNTINYFKERTYSFYYSLAIYGLVNLLYLLFCVNKAWQHYYLPVCIPAVLLIIPFLKGIKWQYSFLVLSILITFQLMSFYSSYAKVLYCDYRNYQPIILDEHKKLNEFILTNLKGKVSDESNILVSAYLPIDYHKLDLTYHNIHVIWGSISFEMLSPDHNNFASKSEKKKFVEKEFIVLKREFKKKESMENVPVVMDALMNGWGGYKVIAVNNQVVIFQKRLTPLKMNN